MVELRFNERDFKTIVGQCLDSGYKPLPIGDVGSYNSALDSLTGNTKTGYYKSTKSDKKFSVTIIDTNRKSVVTYLSLF